MNNADELNLLPYELNGSCLVQLNGKDSSNISEK